MYSIWVPKVLLYFSGTIRKQSYMSEAWIEPLKCSRPTTITLNHTQNQNSCEPLVSRKTNWQDYSSVVPALLWSKCTRVLTSCSNPDSAENRTDVLKKIKFYLPEDAIYRAAQEAISRFRRQQFGSKDRHKLLEIHLSVTWHTRMRTDYSLLIFASTFLCKWTFLQFHFM